MPNFDAGHYFLTMLAPVRVECPRGPSHRHRLQEALARMPNSEVTPNSRGTGTRSPFARNRMTHFARFVVIDDLPYNGREPVNTILAKLRQLDLLKPQPADRLNTPYLLFAADFDAEDGSDGALRRFTDTLWATMPAELIAVFRHCYRFPEEPDADSFFCYVKACQVETTMPFGDYNPEEPKDLPLPPDLATPVDRLSAARRRWQRPVVAMAAFWLLCLLLAALLPAGAPRTAASLVAALGLLALLLGAGLAWRRLLRFYREVMARGAQPMSRGASLPEVLKAIYLQQHFTDHVLATQTASAEGLYAAFGDFLAEHRPESLDEPSQAPGLIGLPGRGYPEGAR